MTSAELSDPKILAMQPEPYVPSGKILKSKNFAAPVQPVVGNIASLTGVTPTVLALCTGLGKVKDKELTFELISWHGEELVAPVKVKVSGTVV